MGIKYKINEEFFDKWNSTMAYVLGFIYADGSLEDGSSSMRGKYLRVSSIDKEIIQNIKKWLDSEHKIQILDPWQGRGKQRYFLRIGSHKLFNKLTKLGLYPNKSLTIKFPQIPEKFMSDFIRGYFDGDGCVYLYKTKNKNNELRPRKLSIIFTSGSKSFLEALNLIIKKSIEIEPLKIYNSKRAYQLRYSTLASIQIFKFLYNKAPKDTYFIRKLKIFEEYFKLRPDKIDKDIKQILMARLPSG